MNSLRQEFLNDYREAIAKYNNSCFVFYLRHMRPVLERFCKLIISDVLADEILYDDLINGNKQVYCDWQKGTCAVQNISCGSKEGSSLAGLAKNVIFYRNQSLFSGDKEMNRLKKTIEGTFNEIYSRYGEISGFNHTASDEEAIIKAEALDKFMVHPLNG